MLSWLKGKPKRGGVASVCLGTEGFSLVHLVRGDSERPRLELSVYVDGLQHADLQRGLGEAVRIHGLQGVPCSAVLRPDVYSLRQIDTPPVEPEEMRDAARWSVKDLIDFPAEDAVIDIFHVPAAESARKKRLYVVAAPSSLIRETSQLIESSGLSLTTIDITELVLRNITQLLVEDEGGVAFMSLAAGEGMLTITRQGSLYLARRLHSEPELIAEEADGDPAVSKPAFSAEAEQMLEGLLLQLQRSFDYYEHQLEQGPVTALFLAPLEISLSAVRDYLEGQLSVPVDILDLNKLLDCEQDLSPGLQADCLTAIGGALREEGGPD